MEKLVDISEVQVSHFGRKHPRIQFPYIYIPVSSFNIFLLEIHRNLNEATIIFQKMRNLEFRIIDQVFHTCRIVTEWSILVRYGLFLRI